jgi:hypothetical protein
MSVLVLVCALEAEWWAVMDGHCANHRTDVVGHVKACWWSVCYICGNRIDPTGALGSVGQLND